ncbi:MAG TPA: DNA mismatch repair endonuclease MutL [Sedimentisphaerales bacterium]|nr:DNA mismatch repair endonuclease MutL [Sedimentisphaerales bacterium]
MGQIVVLDQNMVNMIAAGEVIERPASVVKELMENSIDAGATRTSLVMEDGGRKLISVADNGCGMDAEDLARAFEPHATSKVKTSSDLRSISTLGFRGEALASVASVAQVRAVSRTKESPGGNGIEIDCGNQGSVSPCSADYGTTIQVRDLFYKLPARRKFLKTANTELTHVIEHFTRIALSSDNLDMTLSHNGRELYRLPGSQGLRQRIAELFCAEISQELMEAESDEKGLHIFALMGRPSIARTNNKFQYIFLNGRFIRDKFISHAIREAYRGTLEPDRFPVVFLFIQIPCEDVDVNVHPTKIEVRFYNPNLIHSQILGCLREKLLGTNLETPAKLPLPTSVPEQHGAGSAGRLRSQKIADAMADFFKKHRPGQNRQQLEPKAPAEKRQAPYQTQDTEQRQPYLQKSFVQIHDSFIVAEIDDGFVIIDQHALHERIMYQDLCRRLSAGKLESQRLLIPESFELTEAQADAVEANAELLEKLGIELVPFGPRTAAIQAFPVILATVAPLDFVRDLLDLLSDEQLSLDAERLLDEVLNMAACKAAVKAGRKLNDSEIEQLLADRERVEYTSRCPHGRPTAIKFSINDLEKQFKRT